MSSGTRVRVEGVGKRYGGVTNAAGGLGHGWLEETVAQALAITLVAPFVALVGVLLYFDLRARER
jgi:hypothetical protein